MTRYEKSQTPVSAIKMRSIEPERLHLHERLLHISQIHQPGKILRAWKKLSVNNFNREIFSGNSFNGYT